MNWARAMSAGLGGLGIMMLWMAQYSTLAGIDAVILLVAALMVLVLSRYLYF